MSPVVNPAATIPYEIAADIEYAERRLDSFDKWAFNDHNRALTSIVDAVDAYGRVWGRLLHRQGFSVKRSRPYEVYIGLWVRECIPDDAVVEKAVEVSSAIAEFEAKPFARLKGIDRDALRSDMARRAKILSTAKELGDLVRDSVQADYVHLELGDWVRSPFQGGVGKVAAMKSARVRVTIAKYRTELERIDRNHNYLNFDLIRQTLEIIPPPVPTPLSLPGLEWLLKAIHAQRCCEIYCANKSHELPQYRQYAQEICFAIEMLFLSEQASETMSTYVQRRHDFPTEYGAYFPDWIEGKLRAYFELTNELHDLQRSEQTLGKRSTADKLPLLVNSIAQLGGEMVDLLAHHVADQMGRTLGAEIAVDSESFKKLVCPINDGIRFLKPCG